ncbi:hypothetical protein GKE82_23685 [Conexibacter sp. W3-3-2]|uniref:hypothetical protein n=1 Tax=Conexibacter sp. W3-3-2 TaxID=2675227 RepID=UPI0012B6C036|nr:hypothetical protein [Conexibacter sp. W3-3-2]MTD47208.1 hypothetical protein [Conexibacter sp. W3-3-2]
MLAQPDGQTPQELAARIRAASDLMGGRETLTVEGTVLVGRPRQIARAALRHEIPLRAVSLQARNQGRPEMAAWLRACARLARSPQGRAALTAVLTD